MTDIQSAPLLYPTQSPVFQAAKQSVISLLVSTGIFAGITGVQKAYYKKTGLDSSHLSMKNSIAEGAVLGTVFAFTDGYKRYNNTQIENQHAELLNKYSNAPTIQQDIGHSITAISAHRYKGSHIAQLLGLTGLVTGVGLFATLASSPGYANHKALKLALATTSALTFLSALPVSIYKRHQSVKEDLVAITHAEKLALQREAQRVSTQQAVVG